MRHAFLCFPAMTSTYRFNTFQYTSIQIRNKYYTEFPHVDCDIHMSPSARLSGSVTIVRGLGVGVTWEGIGITLKRLKKELRRNMKDSERQFSSILAGRDCCKQPAFGAASFTDQAMSCPCFLFPKVAKQHSTCRD